FDLYRELRGKEGNLFFSPFSMSTALGMLYGGAEGETEKQMANVLHYDLPEPDLHRVFNYVDLELESRGEGKASADGGKFQLNVVNAAWTQDGYDFLDAYLDLLAVHYGAGLYGLDFAADHEKAREIINGWVADQTNDRIKDLFPEGTILPNTVLALTNAVYFNAAWET
ncbi:MAG: serpin family protein, partial [Myxococcales bacterium]|nr:serpin family protein [Myxococcales bacterium]